MHSLQRLLRLILKILFVVTVIFVISYICALVFVYTNFDGLSIGVRKGEGESCGLVFGAAIHKGSLPGPAIVRRVETAVRLYHEKILDHIIFSGGKGSGESTSEAEVMRSYAIKAGIPAGDIIVEDQSRTTWENLVYSRPLVVSCSMVTGISDRYHLARIRLFAFAQGYSNFLTFPSDTDSSQWFELQSTLREALAILYYLPDTLGAFVARAL